ncbi:sulfotransferase family protein [Plantactinospora solaniradicis]|uniref:Sulfotransferase family protein n=2 Tax=Plantactinospora solaniradicis TaxID=1723736 RepID=A0ABW1KHB6_9ACTN
MHEDHARDRRHVQGRESMLHVIGAGFGRTGTTSLKAALERLGLGPCHTMLDLFSHPEQIPLWLEAARGKPVNWTQVYAEYGSTVDWPGARFWREIAAAFPAAKIVLTARDPKAWYDSARSSIYAAAMEPLPASGADPVFASLWHMSREVVWDGVFDGRFDDREHAIRVYEENNRRVIEEVDADRLLVFEVTEGWKPLCEFLGVPIPDEPFPHANDRAEFTAKIHGRRTAADTPG